MGMIGQAGRWTLRVLALATFGVAMLVVGGAVHAMLGLPDLSEWHHEAPGAELTARDLHATFTLAEYLAREDEVFAEVAERVEQPASATGSAGRVANRYDRASISSPRRAARDWNRTFELVPEGETRAGALLVHGLTDSPYSMRALAERLHAKGVHVLSLRMPGHGTVPAGLVRATGADWMAAVRMGMRHVRAAVGSARPVLLIGYSNGGALVTQAALEALQDATEPAPAALVLLSPMIGVSSTARLARVISLLGPFPFFEKARWLDVVPEFNPFKYNSFPAAAATESHRVTLSVQAAIEVARAQGTLARLPPILAFQSIVDATVSSPAVVSGLFDHLQGSSHELVMFDINRSAGLGPFIRASDAALVGRLVAGGPRSYRRTLVTNVNADTLDVHTRTLEPGASVPVDHPLALAWPAQVFSLSHVALPFPADDPLYGVEASRTDAGIIALGRLSPRGERAVLTVPVDTLMRIGWNPFYPYVADRIEAWVDDACRRAS